jgi:hypothetical protein
MKTEIPGQDFGILHTGEELLQPAHRIDKAEPLNGLFQMEGGVTPPVVRDCLERDHNTYKGS